MDARGPATHSSVCSLMLDGDISNRPKVANVTVNQAFPLMCLNASTLYRTHYGDGLGSLLRKNENRKREQNSYYPHHRLSVCVRVQFHRCSALPVFDVYLRCQSNYSQFLKVKNAAAFWSIELSCLFNASPLCIFQNNNRVCEADGQTVSGRLEILD